MVITRNRRAGMTARPHKRSSGSSCPPDSDLFLVNDNQALLPFRTRYRRKQTRQSLFRLFHCRRPYTEANDSFMAAQRIHSGITKVLVEGNDDRAVLLGPAVQVFVGFTLKTYFVYMLNSPFGSFVP